MGDGMRNQKGFAVSGILYPLFIIFVGVLVGMIGTFINRKLLFDRMKQDVLSDVNYGNTVIESGLLLNYEGSEEPITIDGRLYIPDMSGNGFHGEMKNFTSYMRNEGGKITFNGGNYVLMPNVLEDITTNFTIEMMYAPTSSNYNQYYFGTRTQNFGLETYEQSVSGGSEFRLRLWYPADTYYSISMPNVPWSINELSSISFVFEDSSVTIYHNGLQVQKTNNLQAMTFIGDYIGLGGLADGTNTSSMDLYSFRIYNQALNMDEIYHNFEVDYREVSKVISSAYLPEIIPTTSATGDSALVMGQVSASKDEDGNLQLYVPFNKESDLTFMYCNDSSWNSCQTLGVESTKNNSNYTVTFPLVVAAYERTLYLKIQDSSGDEITRTYYYCFLSDNTVPIGSVSGSACPKQTDELVPTTPPTTGNATSMPNLTATP